MKCSSKQQQLLSCETRFGENFNSLGLQCAGCNRGLGGAGQIQQLFVVCPTAQPCLAVSCWCCPAERCSVQWARLRFRRERAKQHPQRSVLGNEAGAVRDFGRVFGKLGRWLPPQLTLSLVPPPHTPADSVSKGTSLWVPFASVSGTGSAPQASVCKLSSYKLPFIIF